jgi:hypothetical protein
MGERYEMKVYDGTEPDTPLSWWEGWPLTLAVVLLAAARWMWTLWMVF